MQIKGLGILNIFLTVYIQEVPNKAKTKQSTGVMELNFWHYLEPSAEVLKNTNIESSPNYIVIRWIESGYYYMIL